MASLEGVKPGDTLLMVTKYGGRREAEQEPRQVTVHKVGRTLIHILRYKDRKETDTYRIENGVANDGYGHTVLWKPEDWESEKKRDGLEDALKRHGVEVWRQTQPIAVLEALLDVLERAKKGELK